MSFRTPRPLLEWGFSRASLYTSSGSRVIVKFASVPEKDDLVWRISAVGWTTGGHSWLLSRWYLHRWGSWRGIIRSSLRKFLAEFVSQAHPLWVAVPDALLGSLPPRL
jgi:hypothetical protein